MKALILSMVFAASFATSFAATAAPVTRNQILIGDSISSAVPGGVASQLWTNVVESERNVIIKSIASPAAALGARDHTGFNNQETLNTIRRIGGYYKYYDNIIIQALTNDFGRDIPIEDTAESLRNILKFARQEKKRVLLMDALWRADENQPNARGYTLHSYRYVATIICVQEFADVCRMAYRKDTVMGSAKAASFYDVREIRGKVQLHPNATGNRHMATWVKQAAARYGMF